LQIIAKIFFKKLAEMSAIVVPLLSGPPVIVYCGYGSIRGLDSGNTGGIQFFFLRRLDGV
jgi:hypothetical protein